MSARDAVLGEIWRSAGLVEDFGLLVQCGGRLAGSESEAAALAILRERLGAIPGARNSEHAFDYHGWANQTSRLELLSPTPGDLPCHALVWSGETPDTGLEAEVLDFGRGAPEDFATAGESTRGRLVMVRHEYPFATNAIHRRLKYVGARDGAAAGFLIAGELPGELLVTGSCGQDTPDNIPAVGVSRETAAALSPGEGGELPRVRLTITNRRQAARGVNLIAEVPGAEFEWVVVCAHYDGHDLAESALDNATGAASALHILGAFAPHVGSLRRGLRVILFTAEEWGLMGSRHYTDEMDDDACAAVSVAIALDTLAGSPRMRCLTSGFAELDDFVEAVGAGIGLDMRPYRPLMRNSDHYNFVRRGIPALRMVAGFDEPEAGARYLLTSADSRDKVPPADLKMGALAAAETVWRALTWPGPIAPHKTRAEVEALLNSIG